MVRCAVALTCLFAAAAALVSAQDKDPVKDKLFAAKVAYDKDMAAFRKATTEWLDKREDAARTAGDKKALDAIKADREAFNDDGLLPKTAPPALKQQSATARKALESAYAQAVKDYIKTKKDDEASAVENEWKSFVQSSSGVIDLLALVEPKAHAVSGTWKKDGNALVGVSGSGHAPLQLQYEPGEEYDIEVTCRRLTGNECFAVGLVAGGRQVLAVLDGWPGSGFRSGLDRLDEKEAAANATTIKGGLLKTDKTSAIMCSVRDGKIDVLLNGKVVFAYKGDFARLSLAAGNGPPNKNALFLYLGPHTTSFAIERVTATPVKGRGKVIK